MCDRCKIALGDAVEHQGRTGRVIEVLGAFARVLFADATVTICYKVYCTPIVESADVPAMREVTYMEQLNPTRL